MTTLVLQSDSITVAQAVKAVGLVGSGGQAKAMVRDGKVMVNGIVEKQPGRKLIAGDRFGVLDGEEWVVARPE